MLHVHTDWGICTYKTANIDSSYIDVIYKKTDMQVGIILFFLKI